MPRFKVAFDTGRCPQRAVAMQTILLTHGVRLPLRTCMGLRACMFFIRGVGREVPWRGVPWSRYGLECWHGTALTPSPYPHCSQHMDHLGGIPYHVTTRSERAVRKFRGSALISTLHTLCPGSQLLRDRTFPHTLIFRACEPHFFPVLYRNMQRLPPSRLVMPPAYEPGVRSLLTTHQQLQDVPGRCAHTHKGSSWIIFPSNAVGRVAPPWHRLAQLK